MAAMLKSNSGLVLVEGNVLLTGIRLAAVVIDKAINNLIVEDAILNDFLAVRFLNLHIQKTCGLDSDKRSK